MSTPDSPPLGDAPMRAMILAVAATGLVFTFAGLAFFGGRAALGVAVGASLATLNLALFARIGDAFLARRGRTAPWTVIAALKLVVLFSAVWLILKSGIVPGLALAAGYAALPFGITLGSLFGPKPPESGEDTSEDDQGR